MREEQTGLAIDPCQQKSTPVEEISTPTENPNGQTANNDLFENDLYVWSLLLLVNKKES
jgi:hypothetical protein